MYVPFRRSKELSMFKKKAFGMDMIMLFCLQCRAALSISANICFVSMNV